MATAALEEGVITPKASKIVCGHGLQLGNRFLNDSGGNHGMPDIHAAIVHSCDGYFYRLGLKMGVDMIHDWVSRFGMGQKTGVDLPSEQRGIIPSREWKKRVNPRDPAWKDFDTAIASIGQGSVAVPPLQLLRAEAGIITGGKFYKPHVFKEARATQLAPVKYFDNEPTELKLSPTTVAIIDYALWGVVNEGGTAGRIGFPRELNIGGKTGTGQNEYKTFGPGLRVTETRSVNRTATFVFFIGDRFFGTITAHVAGPESARYQFTSALPVKLFGVLLNDLKPMLDDAFEWRSVARGTFSMN